VNRQALREVLHQDINLHNDKEFDHYEESENGVTAYFKDGTTFTGDIIVGADGAHSAGRYFTLAPTTVPLMGY
jgi:2-polyprenyl-6-methoxyphenol hydroxylase-like FAD-dependent oxidoreductase